MGNHSLFYRVKWAITVALLAAGLNGCTAHRQFMERPGVEVPAVTEVMRQDRQERAEAREQGFLAVRLALMYHREGAVAKSGETFLEAAGLFQQAGERDEERRALQACLRCQLASCDPEGAGITAERLRGLTGRYELPAADVRQLMNLADQMNGRPITYPVPAGVQFVFESEQWR